MVTLEQQPLRINEDYNYNAAATAKYYFGFCAVGGMLSAGTTHLVMTPLDVLKVNMQVNPVKYNSICSSYKTLLREHGPSAFWRGWAGKFIGYGVQGGCRFGLYEYFKSLYSNVLPHTNRSLIFFISSASAEVFANLGLCPFEAIKVKVQAQPHFAKGLSDGFPRLYASEGLFGYDHSQPESKFRLGVHECVSCFVYSTSERVIFTSYCSFYRGLVPLFGRNLPFCTVMFSTFEHSADLLYRKVMQRRKEDCTKAQQLGVTCMAGYAAGSVGSFVSNPADNIVSCLYNGKADNVIMAIKKIGISNLFTRSLPIRIMLVGPAVTLQWLFYDTFKVFSGLSASGEVRSEVEIDGAN
ncbi:mitochondrial phosphate carrier protein 1, mitochondrial isoform X1 [Mercurialis annua]|uniref:mitochondrial phosphate carrier protein 1, mitochondrial isoform X1 n=1 Tax=Mercurialis annua TaxID=3986 RepID=UPI00215DF23C|nr:mitochondrial phosphate carrier protein 1, mitochondrial isoform X1 [Mercurialis annua]